MPRGYPDHYTYVSPAYKRKVAPKPNWQDYTKAAMLLGVIPALIAGAFFLPAGGWVVLGQIVLWAGSIAAIGIIAVVIIGVCFAATCDFANFLARRREQGHKWL